MRCHVLFLFLRYHNTHSCHVLFLFLRYHNTHSCEYCNKLFHERFEDAKGIIGSRNWMTDNTMTTRKGPKDKQCLTKNTKKTNNWAARSLLKTWGKLMFLQKGKQVAVPLATPVELLLNNPNIIRYGPICVWTPVCIINYQCSQAHWFVISCYKGISYNKQLNMIVIFFRLMHQRLEYFMTRFYNFWESF